MRIKYIHNELLKKGIDSYSSWLGKEDGCYIVCRLYNSKSKEAKVYLVPIADDQDDKLIETVLQDCKRLRGKAKEE